MSTLAVVEEIMRETAVPMSVKEIVSRAGSRLPSRSRTPDTVVARDLSMDLKRNGETSAFVRTAPGQYTLREFVVPATVDSAELANASAVVPATEAALRGQDRAPMRSSPRRPESVDDAATHTVSVG